MMDNFHVTGLSVTILCTILFLFSFTVPGNAQTLFSCESSFSITNPFLHTVDPNTGETLSTTEITLAGETVRGCNGLARDPMTGMCWMMVNVASDPGTPSPRVLATIDPESGVATAVGNTGGAFAGIAFDSTGTLYGVTGDGASTPETLFTLSKTDGTPTFVQTLGNGDDGEAIAFNPNDGLIYHTSGKNSPVFETINPNTGVVTPIPISGDTSNYEEQTAIVHQSGNALLIANREPFFLHSITTGGVVSQIGPLDHISKGLAFDCGVSPTPPVAITDIPTLSEWGLIAMAGVLGIISLMVFRRRNRTA